VKGGKERVVYEKPGFKPKPPKAEVKGGRKTAKR